MSKETPQEIYPDVIPFLDEQEFFSSNVWPIFMAFLIGPLVGVSISLFKWSIPKITLFLTNLPYHPALVFGVASVTGSFIMGLLLHIAPIISGPGISDATLAIVDRKGEAPWYWWPIKEISTILCVATGGGGLVGPSFFSGMAVGIFWSHILGLKEKVKRQTMSLLGAGAGVGAFLLAPIGGTLVGIEALAYKKGRGQLALYHTVAAMLTSLLAYLTTGALTGYSPVFQLGQLTPVPNTPTTLLHTTLAALVGAVIAKLYIQFYRLVGKHWSNFGPRWLHPALGALAAVPIVILFSGGYSSTSLPLEIGRPGLLPLQDALLGKLGLVGLLALTVGKSLDVGLRSGSGGSVGIFGPAMWIGGMGAALVGFLPGVTPSPLLVVAGITAGVTAALEVPLAGIVIVLEILGKQALVPAIIGGVIGAIVWRMWDKA